MKELVLSIVLIPDLWRLQVVYKDWHKLVRDPSFHELGHPNGNHLEHEYLCMWRDLCSEFGMDTLFVRTLSFLNDDARRY